MSGPWRREDFLRLEPEVSCVALRLLDLMKPYGGLENVKVGKRYILRMPESYIEKNSRKPMALVGGDSVDAVMKYGGDRDSGRLGHVPPIDQVDHDEIEVCPAT